MAENVSASATLTAQLALRSLEPVDEDDWYQPSTRLQCENLQRLHWGPRQPLYGEEPDDRELEDHQELKKTGSGSLVFVMNDAEYRDVNNDQGEGGK
jgi:hypothetical protein